MIVEVVNRLFQKRKVKIFPNRYADILKIVTEIPERRDRTTKFFLTVFYLPISRNFANRYTKCIGFSLTDAADMRGGIQAKMKYINEK